MAGIEELLERLVTDRKFRTELEQDPKAALAGYELSDDDREVLAAQLSTDAGKAGTVEQRTSKSALMAALGALEGVGESAGSTVPDGTSNTMMLGESPDTASDPSADLTAPPAEEAGGRYVVTSARHSHAAGELTEGLGEAGAGEASGSQVGRVEGIKMETDVVEATPEESVEGLAAAETPEESPEVPPEPQDILIFTDDPGVEPAPEEGPEGLAAAETPEEAGYMKIGDIKGESIDHDAAADDPDQPVITGAVYNADEDAEPDPALGTAQNDQPGAAKDVVMKGKKILEN